MEEIVRIAIFNDNIFFYNEFLMSTSGGIKKEKRSIK